MFSHLRRVAGFVAVASAAVCLVAGDASASPVTTAQSGAVGPWLGSWPGWHQCYEAQRWIDTDSARVGRTSTYPNSSQTIMSIPRIDITADGTNWSTYKWGYWDRVVTSPGQYAILDSQRIGGVPQGYGFRVVQYFRWYVGASLVGQVVDGFTSGSYAGHTFNSGGINAGCY